MKTLVWSSIFFCIYFLGFSQHSLQAQSAPVIAGIEDYEATYNSATINFDTDSNDGTAYAVYTKFREAPTKTQIIAGQDKNGNSATWSSSQSVTAAGDQQFTATGLPENTQLYAHVVHVDAAGNQSNILTSNSIVTPIVSMNCGCTDSLATNYDVNATIDDNSCTYADIDCSICTVVMEASDGFIHTPTSLGVFPGDTICFRNTTHGTRLFQEFIGTEDEPYFFTNCDGQAVFNYSGGGEVIEFQNSQYIRFSGTGHTSTHEYGIKLTGDAHMFRGNEKVSDIEVDHIEMTGGKSALWIVTRPVCGGSLNRGNWITYNHFAHHNYIHDVSTEAFYIGGSKWNGSFSNVSCGGEPLYQADLIHVRIYNNIVEGTGWDGIQVGGGIENTWVYNNTVKNYGLENNASHQIGILFNPGTVGQIFANTIDYGTGPGIQIQGFDAFIYSNLIIDPEGDGIVLTDRSPIAGRSNRIINNTIINSNDDAIDNNSTESDNNFIYNNLLLANVNGIETNGNETVDRNIILSEVVSDDYADTIAYDYTPVAGTDPIDSGRAFSFEADSLIVDLNLKERTRGGINDIGAFEYDEDNLDGNANAAPSISDAIFEIDENTSVSTSVGIVTASDPDGNDLTFSIVSGNDLGTFQLDPSSGAISVADAGPLDFETNPSFSLTVEVSDGELTDDGIITVNLIDLDESTNTAPSISNATFEIDENASISTSVGIVTASDPDGNDLTFSIVSGNDLGAFQLDPSSGAISVADAGPLDYETNPTFSLTVEVSDGELTDDGIITVNLIDLPESTNAAPSILNATFEIDENRAVETFIGIVNASDPDGDELTFSIVSGNDLGAFQLDQSSGVILVADAGPLDFETNPSFSLAVEVSDGELTDDGIITVNLIDLDESTNTAPSISDVTFEIDENRAVETFIGIVNASDPDGDELTFSIVSGNDLGTFQLDQSSGVILVADAGPLNFETNPSFSLAVEVSDGELTDDGIITVNLIDLDESTNAAPSISNATFEIDENGAVETFVGIVNASDPDGDELTFSIVSGNDLGTFQIDQSSGVILVADAEPLNFDTRPTYNLEVEASDGELKDFATIIINLKTNEFVLGISDEKRNDVELFPNPAKDFINIEWSSFEQAIITDLTGKQLIESKNRKLFLRTLPSGVYLIDLFGNNNEIIRMRFIKE